MLGMEIKAALLGGAMGVAALNPFFTQGFEADTSSWSPSYAGAGAGYLTRVPSGGSSGASSGASSGDGHARVTSAAVRNDCYLQPAPSGLTLQCDGPSTNFSAPPAQPFPPGGFSTSLDIFLDSEYAATHRDCGRAPCVPDASVLNTACLTDPNGAGCEGTRFDWSTGLASPDGGFLREFAFNVATAPDPGGHFPCDSGFVVSASPRVMRSGANPYDPDRDPVCIPGSGWYTFKASFYEGDGGSEGLLQARMEILDAEGHSVKHWILPRPVPHPAAESATPISAVGCVRYGALANEEIDGLAIDNGRLLGCKRQPVLSTRLTDRVAITGEAVIASATLEGASGGATGTVDYSIYTDPTCTRFAGVGGGAKPGNAGTRDVEEGRVADSPMVTFPEPGTFYWQASYSGDGENLPARSECASQRLDVVATSAQIASVDSSCEQYAGGAAGSIFEVGYGVRGSSISSVSPAGFTYFLKVSGGTGDVVTLTQTRSGRAVPIPIQKDDIALYTSYCARFPTPSLEVSGDSARLTLPAPGHFILGVRYRPDALERQSAPSEPVSYSFHTAVEGTPIPAALARVVLVRR